MELMRTINEERLYKKAKQKAAAIRSFYFNLTAYCVVIPILIFINLRFTPDFYWFVFSMLGWGTGLCFHGMGAFDWNPFLGKDWEARKIQELMEKENRKQQNQQ